MHMGHPTINYNGPPKLKHNSHIDRIICWLVKCLDRVSIQDSLKERLVTYLPLVVDHEDVY